MSDADVGAASKRVAGLSPEEEQGLARSHRNRRKEAMASVGIWWIKAGGVLGVIAAAAAAIGIIYATWQWLVATVANPARLDQFITGATWTALTALSTLTLKRFIPDIDGDDRDRS